MTIGEWLAARAFGASPPQLDARVRAMIGNELSADASKAPDVLAGCVDAALRDLMQRGDHTRAIAHDLLAIDALVTYACAAAAERIDNPDQLRSWCIDLIDRVARHAPRATRHPPPATVNDA